MKNKTFIAGIGIFLLAAVVVSCRKEKETADLDSESIENETVSSFVEKSLSTDEDAAAMRGPLGGPGCNWTDFMPDCATITESSETYPKTITIDYGSGCTGPNNITKSGILIIHLTDDMMNTGAVRTVSFENYQVNNTQITGSRVTTNIGTNGDGQPIFSREVSTVITRNGNTISRIANEEVTWLSGFETDACGDNVFSITGTGSCTRPNGILRTKTITTPLVVDFNCGYIISGVVEITGPHRTGNMNFGDGTCDDIATVTRPNGMTQTVHLHQH